MYRTLGLPYDASKNQVLHTTARLRKKYANNEEALERVETANLWILTKMLSQKEEEQRQRQQANRLRELGDSPKRLFQKYIAGYVPPGVRQMIEPPSTKHFRWASGLLGLCALLGLCVPASATNFVGLAGAATMGFVYQRNRPEPVKDEFGNAGEVRKINPKEMAVSIGLVACGVLISGLLAFGLTFLVDAPTQVIFCTTSCFIFWLVALFFKVYGCFDEE